MTDTVKPSIFIIWSGDSEDIALALGDFLERVFQKHVNCWISGDDIQPGERWRDVLNRALRENDCAIACLIPTNLEARWLLFEAGAISKNLNSLVVPYCVGFKAQLLEAPLSNFQKADANEDGTRKLVEAINNRLPETPISKTNLDGRFDDYWPDLEKRLKETLNKISVHPVTLNCITESNLLRLEAALGERRQLGAVTNVYVNASYPVELDEPEFAQCVMQNIRRGVEYRYVFTLDHPEQIVQMLLTIWGKRFADLDNLELLTQGNVQEGESQPRGGLRIYMTEENYGIEYCIHNAAHTLARCYLRRPEITVEPEWFDWCKQDKARKIANQVKDLCGDDRPLIIRSTTSCDFYNPRKQVIEKVDTLKSSLANRLPAELLQACIG